jgi:transglutaminase-like putative cysteine protease
MKLYLKILAVVFLPLAFSCSDNYIIRDKNYANLVDTLFKERRELARSREKELFSVFEQPMDLKHTQAMKFLYAFMPLSDLADYDGHFFLADADAAIRAREESPWGKKIPEDIFLHYVLPPRVNNENLDSFRIKYYDEIMARVKNRSIIDAALELNHWCHEKVVYQPSDIRTSAPMSTILSARGRCGEESTFTVAALRTAGIPARQVYTPRWAHTDDNHAWVEVWSGGKWYYMGACEPEPVIDRGWFTEPARRAMLVHTKSFGAPTGDENAINCNRFFTEVNELSKYAVTKRIYVSVADSVGRPIKGATVEYQLYNYAEFYPLAKVPSDSDGISSFETGLGDLLVWAYDSHGMFDYQKISVAATDTIKLVLVRKPGDNYTINLDLDVPVELTPLQGPSEELVQNNTRKLAEEDKIRQAYIDSWMKPEQVKEFAINLNTDTSRIVKVFRRSMGNYSEIRKFLLQVPDSLMDMALRMLEILPDKDLRDTRSEILKDHLIYTFKYSDTVSSSPLFVEYILNPRVANEMLAGWRNYFWNNLPWNLVQEATSNPGVLADYLDSHIKIDNSQNYYGTPITPVGVNKLKVSDSFSRDICFVAMCRSMGIPSRLEPGSNVPQYYFNSVWHDVFFKDQKRDPDDRGFIKLVSSDKNPVPEYYAQFTLAKFINGRYTTLEYDYNRKITDFRDELSLSPGHYMLVTGNRLPTGRILAGLTFFNLKENEHKVLQVELRKDDSGSRIVGKIRLEDIIPLLNTSVPDLGKITEKGVVIMWLEPGKEPTRHIFSDMLRLKQDFDAWGGYFIFLTSPSITWDGPGREEAESMPYNILFGQDNKVIKSVIADLGMHEQRLPLVILADNAGNIIYASEGYSIGIGEQILRFTR